MKLTTITLLRLCATFESATGVVQIAFPDFLVRVLFGSGGLSSDIVVSRGAGLGPFVLGLACWPIEDDVAATVIWAQLVYNLLVALYLGYLRIAGGFVGALLWPACALHAVIALLLAVLAYERVSAAKAGRTDRN